MTMAWVKPGKALLGLGLLVALLAVGCGGGGGSSSGPPPPPTVSVSVSPGTASLSFGATQQFTATVTGTSNTAVTWSVKGGGTISSTGLYTAPSAALPSPNTPTPVSVAAGGVSAGNNIVVSQLPTVTSPATITATSKADTTKSASASATIKVLAFIAAGLGTSGGGTAFTLARGASGQLFVVGTGFLPGTTYAITGPNDITLGQPSFCQTTDVPPLPCATVPITVNSNAQTGPRNIMVKNQAGELTVFVGGLVIQ
jgi:hypothetical protein